MSNRKFQKLLDDYLSTFGRYVACRDTTREMLDTARQDLESYVEQFVPCDGCGRPGANCKCEPEED